MRLRVWTRVNQISNLTCLGDKDTGEEHPALLIVHARHTPSDLDNVFSGIYEEQKLVIASLNQVARNVRTWEVNKKRD